MRIAVRWRCVASARYTVGWKKCDAVVGMIGVVWGRLLHSLHASVSSRRPVAHHAQSVAYPFASEVAWNSTETGSAHWR
jgi:hypothetical protein